MRIGTLCRHTLFTMARLCCISIAAATLSNLFLPWRISWFEDWDHRVETLALKHRIAIVDKAFVAQHAMDSFLLDARPAEAYDAGHIDSALSVPLEDYENQSDIRAILDPVTPIIVYCSGVDCDDSLHLILKLRQDGLSQAVLYAGGWEEWHGN